MTSNRQIVADAFAAWQAGTAHVSTIFAPDMRWEIAGRSIASRSYDSAKQFADEVMLPFGARFDAKQPFRPVTIRAIYTDDAQDTVTVVWDGEGTTIAGTTYRNTYAWFLTLRDGLVVEGLAFFDSKAFDELWTSVTPAG